MTDKVVVLITASSRRECKKIAQHLVEAQLAACVNITQGIESVYRWEGKIQTDPEYLMIIKTTRELFDELKHAVGQIHSYHTPEIICLPIIDGSRNYLDWVENSVKKP